MTSRAAPSPLKILIRTFVLVFFFSIPATSYAVGTGALGGALGCITSLRSSRGGADSARGQINVVPTKEEELQKSERADLYKECIDPILRGLAADIVSDLVNGTLNWARGGFEGKPTLFVTNTDDYFRRIGEEQAHIFLDYYGKVAGEYIKDEFDYAADQREQSEFFIPNCEQAACASYESSPETRAYYAYIDYVRKNNKPEPTETEIAIKNCEVTDYVVDCSTEEKELFYAIRPQLEDLAYSSEQLRTASRQQNVASSIRSALIQDQKRNPLSTLQPTLTGERAQKFQVDFREGGWKTWIEYTLNPSNNAFGGYIAAANKQRGLENNARWNAEQQALQGGGFVSNECDEYTTGEDGQRVCSRYVTKTPPKTVGDVVANAVTSGPRQLEQADEMSEVFAAAFSAVIQGLTTRGLTERVERPESLEFEDPDADLNSQIPGRTASKDATEFETPNEPAGDIGGGLPGGVLTLEETIRTTDIPASGISLNFNDPKYVDWVYPGYRDSFGIDIERKNYTYSYILDFATFAEDTLLSTSSPAINVSWTQGTPRESFSGVASGLSIKKRQNKFSFTLDGGDREQEVSMYLGANRARGNLSIRLSGATTTKSIFVDGRTSPTEQMIKFKYIVPAGQTLSVEYLMTENTGTVDTPGTITLYAVTVEETVTLYPPVSQNRKTPPTEFVELLGEWPGDRTANITLSPGQYISLFLKTKGDSGTLTVEGPEEQTGSGFTSGGSGESFGGDSPVGGSFPNFRAAFSKYMGDLTSQADTKFNACLESRHLESRTETEEVGTGLSGSTETKTFTKPVIDLQWGSGGGEEVCGLQNNTRYYLTIICDGSGSGAAPGFGGSNCSLKIKNEK